MAIGESLQKLWNAWNIRSLLLLSLCIQIILAYGAPLRRKTSSSFTIVVVWSTYLLADWAAIYAFGLISNTVRTSSVTPSEVNQDILALWASFLLIHMGGPDTITAYSLEDNALWLRHLLSLVAKLFIFGYIFMKSFPGNDLVAPTVLVLVTGVLKYGERIRALFLASLDNLKSSVRGRWIDEIPEKDHLHDNYFFERFVGLIVDILPSYSETMESREFFLNQNADAAFNVISGELNLMYEVLYTKIMAVHSTWGIFSCWTFLINMVAVLVLFCLSKKAQVEGVDVWITFGLLAGAFIVHMNSRSMVIKSDWATVNFKRLGYCLKLLDALFRLFDIVPLFVTEVFVICCLGFEDKLWSETIGSFNLLESCFRKHRPRNNLSKATECCGQVIDFTIRKCGLAEKLDKMKYTKRNKFDKELWKFIFDVVRRRASDIDNEEKERMVYESKGELIICENGCDELMRYMKDFELEKVFLTWHIATEICYNIDQDGDDKNRTFSKILSDYMMYLMIQRSKMMSPVVGIEHERYSDTRDQTKELVRKLGAAKLEDFCIILLEDMTKAEPTLEQQRCGKSVLLDACGLALMLQKNSKKWEVILGVWVEMLSYAASHSKVDAHVRSLHEGGELISHVWLLMAHLGIGSRRPEPVD